MRYEMLDKPDFAMVKVTFDQPGEKMVCEASAMVARSSGMTMETNMRGGLLAAAKRKLMGGESLFQNTYTAKAANQEIFLAPPTEGDLRMMDLAAGQSFFLQSGAYVAHVGDQGEALGGGLGHRSSFEGLEAGLQGLGGRGKGQEEGEVESAHQGLRRSVETAIP